MSHKDSTYDDFDNKLNEAISDFLLPGHNPKSESWEQILNKINQKSLVENTKTRSLKIYIFAAAAVLVLFISIGSWLRYIADTEIYCQPGEHKIVMLPDQSKVELNAGSSLIFNKRDWKQSRRVHLYGEAFFNIRKGKSFTVNTSIGKVKVLGTSFNVFARNNKLQVYCKTGKVAVVTNDSVLLTPGLKSVFKKGQYSTEISNAMHEDTWKKGEFWYSNAPLTEVLQEMERQFNVNIIYYGEERYYSGYFNSNSLENALILVLKPLQMQYVNRNNTIKIMN